MGYSDVQKRPEQVQRQVLLEPGIGRLRGPPVLQAARDALVEEKARLVDACLPSRLSRWTEAGLRNFFGAQRPFFKAPSNSIMSVPFIFCLVFLIANLPNKKYKVGSYFHFKLSSRTVQTCTHVRFFCT